MTTIDLKQIKSQESAKRAVEIAVAGRHSVLLAGPLGCGKTMLADAADAMAADSGRGGDKLLRHEDLDLDPVVAMTETRPALDRRDAGFMLIATATDLARVDPALLDRFPIVIEMKRVGAADLLLPCPAESTKDVLARIAKTAEAVVPTAMTRSATELLRTAAEAMSMTARAYENAVRVAGTIARLDGKDTIDRVQVAEACAYVREVRRGPEPDQRTRDAWSEHLADVLNRVAEVAEKLPKNRYAIPGDLMDAVRAAVKGAQP